MPLTTTWTRSLGVEVRVRVLLVDAPVRRPARVTDADRRLAGDRRDGAVAVALAGDRLAQVVEVADRAHRLDRAVGHAPRAPAES